MSWDTPIFHADLDAFYASVEQLRDPSLKGKPVIVGGTSSRGVVTSASYEARAFGVRSAMPTSRARRLCPQAVFIQPDFHAYGEKSRLVKQVFESFSPIVEPLSLDEAFIDMTAAHRLWPSAGAAAEALKYRVLKETGLVVSVGVAPNKFLAKLASASCKPDGILLVRPGEIEGFLDPLPVGALWGVGEQTEVILERLGLKTVGQVRSVPARTLERALGTMGAQIHRLSQGVDDRRVIPDAPRKSVGAEETYEHDLTEQTQMLQGLLSLADRVSSRLRSEGISGRTVTLKARFSDFTTVTRSLTIKRDVDAAVDIYGAARILLLKLLKVQPPGSKRVRLLGVSVSSLKLWPATEQLSFDQRPRWSDAQQAVDAIRLRFGEGAVGFGGLFDE